MSVKDYNKKAQDIICSVFKYKYQNISEAKPNRSAYVLDALVRLLQQGNNIECEYFYVSPFTTYICHSSYVRSRFFYGARECLCFSTKDMFK